MTPCGYQQTGACRSACVNEPSRQKHALCNTPTPEVWTRKAQEPAFLLEADTQVKSAENWPNPGKSPVRRFHDLESVTPSCLSRKLFLLSSLLLLKPVPLICYKSPLPLSNPLPFPQKAFSSLSLFLNLSKNPGSCPPWRALFSSAFTQMPH